jgi:hypothetical protein
MHPILSEVKEKFSEKGKLFQTRRTRGIFHGVFERKDSERQDQPRFRGVLSGDGSPFSGPRDLVSTTC